MPSKIGIHCLHSNDAQQSHLVMEIHWEMLDKKDTAPKDFLETAKNHRELPHNLVWHLWDLCETQHKTKQKNKKYAKKKKKNNDWLLVFQLNDQ